MPIDSPTLRDFRDRLANALAHNREDWQHSRKFLTPEVFRTTLAKLCSAVETSSFSNPLKAALADVFRPDGATRVQDLDGPVLKQLTGLPPAKALRALCLLFGIVEQSASSRSDLPPDRIEAYVREHANPFDLLLETDDPSVLELGAGDLSFASALVAQYLPELDRHARNLTLHCVDRLRPGSRVGGKFHADAERLGQLKAQSQSKLTFRFWGGQDMFEVGALRGILRTYTIVTCHAPPNPTVAYEPTRLSQEVILRHLRETKGEFGLVREEGEEVLEVRHAGRALLFPPWKFDVRGPAALLDLLSRLGRLCVLSAVDTEVFWELLAQLLADPRVRPPDEIFTPTVITRVFGEVAGKLNGLPVGEGLVLSDQYRLRQEIPRVLEKGDSPRAEGGLSTNYRFRYVEVRRGALFPGVPASQTAKLFSAMTQEPPPWFLILIPEGVATA